MQRLTSALRATVRAYTTTAEQRLATPHSATAPMLPPPSSPSPVTSAIDAASTHVASFTDLCLGTPAIALLPPPSAGAAFECGRGDKRTLKGKRKAQSTGKCRPKSSSAKPKLPTQMEQAPHPAPPL